MRGKRKQLSKDLQKMFDLTRADIDRVRLARWEEERKMECLRGSCGISGKRQHTTAQIIWLFAGGVCVLYRGVSGNRAHGKPSDPDASIVGEVPLAVPLANILSEDEAAVEARKRLEVVTAAEPGGPLSAQVCSAYI
jgi:hypothetical protein